MLTINAVDARMIMSSINGHNPKQDYLFHIVSGLTNNWPLHDVLGDILLMQLGAYLNIPMKSV